MSITVKVTTQCDVCGRVAETEESRPDHLMLYGWIALEPRHLSRAGMGHNRVDALKEMVLCDFCWPEVLRESEIIKRAAEIKSKP